MSRLAIFLAAIQSCVVSVPLSQAQKIYWTETGGTSGSHRIRSANADGSGIQTVLGDLHDPFAR